MQNISHFTRVIAGPDEWSAGHHAESELSHLISDLVKFFRRNVTFDRKMFGGRLQILSECQHIDADISQIGTDFQ